MMKTIRRARTGVILAGAVTLALSLAACSSGTPQASTDGKLSGSIRITFGTGSQQAPMDKLVKAFEADHPGTTIKVNYLPADSITQSIVTELRAGNGPDVFYSNGGSGQAYSIQPLAKAGLLAELSGDWTSGIPDAAKALYTRSGKIYGLPLAEVPIGLIYNKDKFTELGTTVPTSMDDLLSACTAAKDAGGAQIALAGSIAGNVGVFGQAVAASYVYSALPDWNADRAAGKTTFAGTKQWKQALEAIVELKDSGCFIPGVEGAGVPGIFNNLADGSAASAPGPAGVIDAVHQIKADVPLGLMPFPGAKSSSTRALIGYTDALAVNAKSKNLALAKAFVDYVGEPANSKVYTGALSAISLTQAASGEVPDNVSDFGPYLSDGKSVSLPNQSWPNADVFNAFTTGIQGLLTGQQKPDDVLAAMDSAWGE